MAFDSIVNTGNEDGGAVDLGTLAESLLFYQSVQLLTKPAQLKDLIRKVGEAQVVALMDRGALHVRRSLWGRVTQLLRQSTVGRGA